MSREDPRCWGVGLVMMSALLLLLCWLREAPLRAAAPEPTNLTDLDARAERRHGEIRIQIESLRRQMLALHGRREIQ